MWCGEKTSITDQSASHQQESWESVRCRSEAQGVLAALSMSDFKSKELPHVDGQVECEQ